MQAQGHGPTHIACSYDSDSLHSVKVLAFPLNATIFFEKTTGSAKSRRQNLRPRRLRELYCAAFLERNLKELAAANRYLDQFASIR
jgi:hypothetical protein